MFPCLLPAAALLAAPLSLPADASPPADTTSEALQAAAGPDQATSVPEDAAPAEDTGIVVQGRARTAADPLENINVKSFAATEKVDDAFTAPLAHGYEHAVPKPVRDGVHNALKNLHEPVVFVNFLLQHKVGKAAETLARFSIDSTIGVAGLVDVAKRKPFHLPRRPNGFADTLGFYGVKPGAFLFLPLIGPTTVRDLVGYVLDRALLPLGPLKPGSGAAFAVPVGLLHTMDRRVAIDGELKRQRDSADPYTSARDYYLARREAEIAALHGLQNSTGPADATGAPDLN